MAATKADYAIQPTRVKPTFPEPLPPYLPRTCNVPPAVRPPREPTTANAGRFSLSLKGMRRGLRKCGFRAESLVLDIEHDMLRWLQVGGVMLNPDDRNQSGLDHDAPGTPIGKTETVFEVSRTPLQLVWFTDHDNFARYVVHCCARYHGIVSFSMSLIRELAVPSDHLNQGKDMSGRRYTYLLRPNVSRPDHHAPGTFDTPPTTDIDYSSYPDSELDSGGHESDSDLEPPFASGPNPLTGISEEPSPMSYPSTPAPGPDSDLEASLPEDSDSETHEFGSDAGIADTMQSLSLNHREADTVDNKTFRVDPHHRQQGSLRRRIWAQGRRAQSSPSRSPPRHPFRRKPLRYEPPRISHHYKSFYDYLFS